MKGFRGSVIAGLTIWIATILQQSLAHRFQIWGAGPDFLLVSLACLCLYTSRVGGAISGFCCGLAMGAITGANLSQYVFSRTIAGFADSWSKTLGLEGNAITAAANAFAVTIFAQLILMFFAPPSGIAAFLGATIGSATVNGVLAIPVHALLRKIIGP